MKDSFGFGVNQFIHQKAVFKTHSQSFVFLGLQASGSDRSLDTCCVSLFKPPHWGEKSYWWEALKTGTGLDAQEASRGWQDGTGPEVERPGLGSPDTQCFKQELEEGALQAGKDYKGPPPLLVKGCPWARAG